MTNPSVVITSSSGFLNFGVLYIHLFLPGEQMAYSFDSHIRFQGLNDVNVLL